MLNVSASIEIRAPREVVWDILLDFPAYTEWNPFIRQIKGEPRAGQRLKVTLEPCPGKRRVLRPRVHILQAERCIGWLGGIAFAGWCDASHEFMLQTGDGGSTQFVQHQHIRGILVPFVAWMLKKRIRRGFEAMNLSLKQRAEARVVDAPTLVMSSSD